MERTTSIFGSIREFNPEINIWDIYKKQLNHFFTANGITEAGKKKAMLLANLSESAYKLLSNLCIPAEPDTKEYKDLVQVLDSHFSPKKSGFAERQKFYTASKISSESLAEWAARVQSLAVDCKFGSELETAIRDKFIMGLEQGPIKDKLFLEDCSSLTLTKARESAENLEAVRSHFEQVHIKQEPQIYRLQHGTAHASRAGTSSLNFNNGAKWRATETMSDKKGGKKCLVCGYTNHATYKCKHRYKICDICGVKGHLKTMCKSGNREKSVKVKTNKYLDTFEQQIFNLEGNNIEPIFFVDVKINDINLKMQIDSGAAMSVISEKLYKNCFSKYCMKKTNTQLITYDRNKITPIGLLQVKINYNNNVKNMNILVIKNGGPPLLGRDFMKIFNLGIKELNSMNVIDSETKVFNRFKKLFSPGMGKFLRGKIKLEFKDNVQPKFMKPFSVPFSIKEKIEKELCRLEKEKIISRVNFSNWGTPIVPVMKKDGSVRICGNYKLTVNPNLNIDRHPLPKIEEIFAKLQGGVEFSKLDLSHAYNQCELTDDSKDCTTISTHQGLFVYNRLAFGISSAPSKFQKVMEAVLMGLDGTVNYLDDIVVTGSTRAEHIKNLIAVLDRLEKNGFTLRKEKCELFKESISYLGYIIDKKGLRGDPEKLKAILDAPRPTDVSKLKSFLGMVNYYRRFIENIATILSPLYQLLKKEVKFEWSVKEEQAFTEIKRLLASNDVLVHYDPNASLVLTVDASSYGVGAVLSHRYTENVERPVAYASRRLTDAETRYSTINKEALAIIYGVTKFHNYLYGRHFTLITDHKPLLSIFGPKVGIPQMAANRLQRYAVFLSGYSFNMEYIKSERNQADGLSRLPVEDKDYGEDRDEMENIFINYISEREENCLNVENIKRETIKDKILTDVIKFVKTEWPITIWPEIKKFYEKRNELNIENDCLFWGYRIVLPQKLRKMFLNELHSSHMGIVKMKSMARSYVWWPSLNKDIVNLAKSCVSCAKNKPNPEKSVLKPWDWPEHPWERVHIDFMGPLYNKYVLIVVDAHSKWIEAIEMNSMRTGETIKQLRSIFSRFGLPHKLVSDNGTSFKSVEFERFCSENNIVHITSPPFHPATNGAAENSVKIIKNGIKNAMALKDKNNDLNYILNNFLMYYRNSIHCTTGETPAKLMLKRNIRTILSSVNPKKVIEKNDIVGVQDKINKQQNKQIKNYKGTNRKILNINDIVLAKDFRNANKPTWAISKIVKKLGSRTYLVEEMDTKIKWKRHINQIRTDIIVKNRQNEIDDVLYDSCVNNKVNDVNIDEDNVTENNVNVDNNTNDVVHNINENSPKIQNRRKRIIKKPDRLGYDK